MEDCAAETRRIEAEETSAGVRQAVAGFDLTFSVPKSVSVLWGVSDAATQERIAEAHHAAVADVIEFFEREVAATRAGFSDSDGAVAQVPVAGVAAVAYDHFDSRAGDPQLHTHVVVSNKVLTVMDGRWRSLDGRPVFASVTALSAHYNALLADRLSRDVGVEWEVRQRGADRNPQWEIVGVSDDLIAEFSSRTREIELKKDELIAEYVARHGRMPSPKTIVELRAQATLATRPPKELRSLADLTAEWRRRASARLGVDATAWAATLVGARGAPLTVDDVPSAAIEAIATDVVAAVAAKRAVWTHWNLMAEASKQTMDLRFATTSDREAFVSMVVDAAQASVGVADSAGAGKQSGPLPARGRHEPLPAAALGQVLLDRDHGGRGSSPDPVRSHDRAGPAAQRARSGAGAHERLGSATNSGPPSRASRRRVARWTCWSVPRVLARRQRCARFAPRGSPSTGGGVSSVLPPPRRLRRRWATTWASPATTRPSGCTSTTTDERISAPGSW